MDELTSTMNTKQAQNYLGGRPFRYFPTLGSTMTAAQDWLAETPDLQSGAVVLADEQTGGKGRLGRAWLTPPRSAIAMSVILRGADAARPLTIAGGLAVALALEAYAPTSIKWANDVLMGGKKISGVLAESLWQGDQLHAAILGIGINLSVDFSQTALAQKATSLHQHTTAPIEREAIIAAVLHNLDACLGDANLLTAWRARLGMLGSAITLYAGARVIRGIAQDVDADGALLVALPDGRLERFLAGDVTTDG